MKRSLRLPYSVPGKKFETPLQCARLTPIVCSGLLPVSVRLPLVSGRQAQNFTTLVALMMLVSSVRCSETWSSKSAHSAFVTGGQILRVAGVGFQSGTDYYCRFMTLDGSQRSVWSFADTIRPHNPDFLRRKPPQSLQIPRGTDRLDSEKGEGLTHLTYAELPDGGVQCAVPQWPLLPQDVAFTIATSPLGMAVPLTGDALESKFGYLAGWDSVDSNLLWRGRASGGTLLRVRAVGLDTLSNLSYSCKFVFLQSAHERKSLSSPANVVNRTLLTCLTPAWGANYAAANVTLSIYHGKEELHNIQQGSTVSCGQLRCGGFSFEYYSVWDVSDEAYWSSVYGARSLTLSGFGFAGDLSQQPNTYLCVFTSEHHTALSVAMVVSPKFINCLTPAWPQGNQIVNLTLFSKPDPGSISSFLVPAVSERHTATIVYSAGWHSKSLNHSLADGGQSVTLSGLGFKPLHRHQDYAFTCRFLRAGRESDEFAPANILVNASDDTWLASDDTWLDAPALILSDSQVTCTVPRWMKSAGRVKLHLRQCVQGICSSVPNTQGVEMFEYKEVWGGVSRNDGSWRASVIGGDFLYVQGLAFRTGVHYACGFNGDSPGKPTMRTAATAVNETVVMCRSPPWGNKFVAQTVRFHLYTNESDAEVSSVAYAQLVNGSNHEATRGQCDDVGCHFVFLAHWQGITMPNRSPLNGRAVLLARGQETIMIHGLAFPPSFASNCTFHAPSGLELGECSTKAQVLSSTLLVCVTRLCVPTESNATLYFTGLYYSAPGAQDLTLESSWSQLSDFGSPPVLVSGNASVNILGVGFGVGSHSYRCEFYDGDTLIASNRAAFNVSVVSDERACDDESCTLNHLNCIVPKWPASVSKITVSVLRLMGSDEGQGTRSIEFTGQSGKNVLIAPEFWARVEPTEAAAQGAAVFTVHGVALPSSTTLLCIFERSGSDTLVTRGLAVSAGELRCPAPQWGHWNAAGRAAGVVWLNVSNDDRFATIDNNADHGISYSELKTASRELAHDDLDAVQFARLFAGIDIDGDKRISLTEFWLWMPKKRSISHSSQWGADLGASILFYTTLDDAAVNSAPSVLLPAGGQQVLISGSGFDEMVQHKCVFTDDAFADHKALSEASVINTTHIMCPSVLWSWPATMSGKLEVLLNGSAVGVFNASVAKLPLRILDAVLRVEPTQASAVGGDTVTVHGYGFNMTASEDYRCLFDGVISEPATVESPFLLFCIIPEWPNASRAVSFRLDKAGRIIDHISVKGVLQYFLVPEPLPFRFFTEVLSIFPAYADRIGGTDGGTRNSPTITVIGAGFSSTNTYRCQLHQGQRMIQSFVARLTSPMTVECVPPEWDVVTGSLRFVSQDVNLTLLASNQAGWISGPVYAKQTIPLKLLQINKVPFYSVKPGSGLNWWVTPGYINISEPVGDQTRDVSFQWAVDIIPGSTHLNGMNLTGTALLPRPPRQRSPLSLPLSLLPHT